MRLRTGISLVLVIGALGATWTALPAEASLKQISSWQRMASPGALSEGHAALENDCAACHTPIVGPTREQCVVCHANETLLLQRQPTAFHASVSDCTECHAEHRGRHPAPDRMDHGALAALGLSELGGSLDSEARNLRAWLLKDADMPGDRSHPGGVLAPSAHERMLDCQSCHSRQDRHFGLMGTDCVACHTTSAWSLEAFRHPSPQSRDCAQCHQAPPSHFMGHFKMVSAKVARKPHANVHECFECHRTTAWTDIPGVGFYKHH